jgi:hypothetical protein
MKEQCFNIILSILFIILKLKSENLKIFSLNLTKFLNLQRDHRRLQNKKVYEFSRVIQIKVNQIKH